MARFYGTKIKAGKIGINDVPRTWREITERWLAENCKETG